MGYRLNGNVAIVAPIEPPKPRNMANHRKPTGIAPKLAVLTSEPKDVTLGHGDEVALYYAMPEGLAMELETLVALFEQNPHLIPWFPAILIGENYQAAVEFIERVKPQQLVTNNNGIAYVAYQHEIDWIAGFILILPTHSVSNVLLMSLKLKVRLSLMRSIVSRLILWCVLRISNCITAFITH